MFMTSWESWPVLPGAIKLWFETTIEGGISSWSLLYFLIKELINDLSKEHNSVLGELNNYKDQNKLLNKVIEKLESYNTLLNNKITDIENNNKILTDIIDDCKKNWRQIMLL